MKTKEENCKYYNQYDIDKSDDRIDFSFFSCIRRSPTSSEWRYRARVFKSINEKERIRRQNLFETSSRDLSNFELGWPFFFHLFLRLPAMCTTSIRVKHCVEQMIFIHFFLRATVSIISFHMTLLTSIQCDSIDPCQFYEWWLRLAHVNSKQCIRNACPAFRSAVKWCSSKAPHIQLRHTKSIESMPALQKGKENINMKTEQTKTNEMNK